jgi:hypothetical protein
MTIPKNITAAITFIPYPNSEVNEQTYAEELSYTDAYAESGCLFVDGGIVVLTSSSAEFEIILNEIVDDEDTNKTKKYVTDYEAKHARLAAKFAKLRKAAKTRYVYVDDEEINGGRRRFAVRSSNNIINSN